MLSPETMKLLGGTKKDIDKDKDGEDVPKLKPVEVVSMHCNLVNNSYQQASKVLFTFVPNKQFGLLIIISPHLLTMLKTTSAEFQSIQFWFTDRNNRPFEIEDRVNSTLIINWVEIIKMRYSTEPKFIKHAKGYGFLSSARKFGDKYGKKLMDTATKTGIDAAKTASKRVVQKIAEATARFITKTWVEVYHQPGNADDRYKPNKQIRFKTSMLRSDLCDYSDA